VAEPRVGRHPGGGRHGVFAAHEHVGGVEGDAERIRPRGLDQAHHLEGSDLLVRLDVEVRARVAQHWRDAVEHLRGRAELLAPLDIGAEPVAGVETPDAELSTSPDLGAVPGACIPRSAEVSMNTSF